MTKKVSLDLKKRLSKEDALDLIKNASLLDLAKMASAKKDELHKEKLTTFIVDRNINYTNVCWVDCKFCAFFRHKKDNDSYVLKFDEIDEKIEELLAIGGTQILFQGGVHPNLKIDYYEELVNHIHTKYPQITIHGFSSIEIDFIAKVSKISILEVLKRLQAKGLSSIPGAGAEILSDRVRDIIAPKKMDTQEWLEVHRLAHSIGMKTTATMMFGTVETDEEIIEHWDLIRKLQDETGGFRAFIMWSFQGENTKLMEEHPQIKPQSSNRYLRLLAVSRLYLDNFKNLQSSWVTQGSYIGQMALKFGANDLGSTMMEENVVKAAGAANRMNQDEMIRLIKDIGEIPAKRDTAYNILERF
ncbi:dehypoxanthine futalosine cyclase [Aliarcobacter cryaerophilus]|jgi:cyclic dehypoxanthinyl futalosine synthase|uniref:Cyclic dehypoxanthine futalosine synthase n=7 Tax=Arcobacteraceae TaxID=2808963 RepID=A0AA96DZP4_9BACT|nr:dehypoxanthine futalosine cyclase [Aliarcobacter cryaerophilus]MBK6302419.1 dehypoxanthine futalosine cyclase [Arcobacter sp.]MBP7251378.1 dehypoxanthine futalosine cyclase [Aliarcobacter sp.]NCB13085.1 dehypoxanthine futalosine cyclase [Erysipelotrichia bacterium]WNL28085.1 dehypoxanthine futalosine cyclase [Arcobacter sp. AZ-2023]WPD04760.1 dehypoxanthine futalosine cyclase [Arcobacter sp. DSM 115956]WPD06855.1 dehypoxanthine futalosine cyclase [Arcobacter sp. DSM 115955]WPD12119.1 dehy